MLCPLCQHPDTGHYHQDKRRHYFQCQRCDLVFADPAALLPAQAEKDQYDKHNNDPADAGYRRFLARLATPLQERLSLGAEGLDFGCGPGPTLSLMMTEAGFPSAIYDPYFAPDRTPLRRQYDFITCTEAIEHFYRPAREWQLLVSLLKPGAWLGLMTKLVRGPQAFAQWHYKNDPTHVSFFSQRTFEYLAKRDGLVLEFIGADVILLQKPA
ncbi:2-polyprenyl-3-methyl-5-hydroxy-6-metoxy-1,4-ben zoquinolmethylase [Ferrimonas balearica DSM 9799]|uniref:2-polyprenyl-3-methyl-5-hydroxy-6-metoxy-1,4-ben zoquinolmethylase n=1 Tax=Ferrimonas balearica (strain DSM 9799 / CCM 4581 / KCTC 23876 / PAT) TaxID=550540 RepID=E1SR05_FERBD|nr:class I SAM-dependent methyltransferase [Ferrimonas balearica]ADN77935.1 2-polyprenyl-3-methyl-5-hydroxy-6-metoxy-1,4-ben zoquinolmethylase [Ferrimonas balearica DSM 9799]MBW3141374.1 class I SAM-dependent methyltransferase [Ferrimonas balearica]MBW3166460.1 class I SAM-dependent methyltransferase [Ferrimonas balearica]MBY5982133.1 class I SAM-dependent methyltransferase [Ferrimonas balearica]MBY6096585.1 class I SAM-dependent methyltransferase [Ferrimonas balearica]